jgi:Zn-dependent protease
VRIDPGLVIALAVILLVALPVHEFSHALAAYRLGDGTAKMMGRLTLNPLVHFDPVGGTLLIISWLVGTGIGWAKPTPVNPHWLRGGQYGEAIVAFAGPLSNLVLATAAALPLRYIYATRLDVPDVVFQTLFYLVIINLALMVFNLLPIPPLDGSKVLFSLLDPRTAQQYRATFEQYGIFLLLLLIFPIGPGGSIIGRIFGAVIGPLFSLLVGVPYN